MTDRAQAATTSMINRTEYFSRSQLMSACLEEGADMSNKRRIGALWVIFTKMPEHLEHYGKLSFVVACGSCKRRLSDACRCDSIVKRGITNPYYVNPTRKDNLWLVSKQSVTDMLPELERLVSVYQSGVRQEHKLKNLHADALTSLRKWVERNFEEP